MVAARLGKRANRGGFVNSFWWSPAGQDGHGGMGDVLTALEAEPVDWPAAVDAFTAAADAVRALAAQRQKAATAIERLAAAETERRQAWAAIRAAEQTCRQLVERGRAVERSLAQADGDRLAVHNAYDGHRNERPGLLVSLATRFRAGREWHADHLALRNAGQDAARRRDQAAQALNRLRGQLSDARKASQRDRAKLARLDQQTRAWRD
jgi:chromosome segregation ATPase